MVLVPMSSRTHSSAMNPRIDPMRISRTETKRKASSNYWNNNLVVLVIGSLSLGHALIKGVGHLRSCSKTVRPAALSRCLRF
eukprot:936918-Amphidinium_carterae.1